MDPNSMFIWLPKVQEAGIPSPRTVMVDYPREVIAPVFDGEPTPDLERYMATLVEAASAFSFPLFLRTDLASGKHTWTETCYVPSLDVLPQHAIAVAEQNELAGFFGLDYAGFAVREFLELDATFEAFKGMPVAAERRYFAEEGQIRCHHAYWFEGAIESSWREKPADWKERLAILNDEASDPPELTKWASQVTRLLPGAWSVDFARLRDRRHWVLIDMALADASWHPEHEKEIA